MDGIGGSGRKYRIMVWGDGMTDVYYDCSAAGLSAEAPIPVLKLKKRFEQPGGAGNVAANLERLGCSVITAFNVGPFKHRLMVGDHQVARWDSNDKCEPLESHWRDIYKSYADYGLDAIVVADYGKGSINQGIINYIKENYLGKVPIFVDTKQDPTPWGGVADAIFPNFKEYQQYQQQYNDFHGLVCIKHGDLGIYLYNEYWAAKYNPLISPAQARFVRNVNGAGDTVIAAFTVAWLREKDDYDKYNEDMVVEIMNFERVLRFANTAAAIAVENPYTYAPTLEEVEKRFYGNA